MSLHIESAEADRLARELARRRNKPVTVVVVEALRSELAREKRGMPPRNVAEKLLAIGARYSAIPDLDDRTDDQILGYDDMSRPD